MLWADASTTAAGQDPNGPMLQGTYLVKTDVASGTWRAPGGPNCYWARLRDLTGSPESIVANDAPRGPVSVQIAASDAGFKSRGCGTWTKAG